MRTASNPAPALEQTPRRPCSFPVLFLGCLAALLILTILAIGVGRYAISRRPWCGCSSPDSCPSRPPGRDRRRASFLPCVCPAYWLPCWWGAPSPSLERPTRGSLKPPGGARHAGRFGWRLCGCLGWNPDERRRSGISRSAPGRLAAVLLAIAIPKVIKNQSMMTLVLAGVIISADERYSGPAEISGRPGDAARSITHWQLGSLATAVWRDVFTMGPPILAAIIILLLMRWRINILSLGENEAKSLGMDIRRARGSSFSVPRCSPPVPSAPAERSAGSGW